MDVDALLLTMYAVTDDAVCMYDFEALHVSWFLFRTTSNRVYVGAGKDGEAQMMDVQPAEEKAKKCCETSRLFACTICTCPPLAAPLSAEVRTSP